MKEASSRSSRWFSEPLYWNYYFVNILPINKSLQNACKERHVEQGFWCKSNADIINHAAEQKYEKENVEGKRYR